MERVVGFVLFNIDETFCETCNEPELYVVWAAMTVIIVDHRAIYSTVNSINCNCTGFNT